MSCSYQSFPFVLRLLSRHKLCVLLIILIFDITLKATVGSKCVRTHLWSAGFSSGTTSMERMRLLRCLALIIYQVPHLQTNCSEHWMWQRSDDERWITCEAAHPVMGCASRFFDPEQLLWTYCPHCKHKDNVAWKHGVLCEKVCEWMNESFCLFWPCLNSPWGWNPQKKYFKDKGARLESVNIYSWQHGMWSDPALLK